tara:strand:- start:1446 stop:1820 length:375 start_codon:yes stop_codon:yes gene_type:complete
MRRLDFDLDSNYSNLRPAKPISSADIEQAEKDLEGALMGGAPIPIGMTLCGAKATQKFGITYKELINPTPEVKAFLDQCRASNSSTTPAEEKSEELREKSQAQNKIALLGLLGLFGLVYIASKK